MKLVQTTVEKNFIVEHNGQEFFVNYLDSDGQILGLINRFVWEIVDQEHRDITLDNKQEKLIDSLIGFCIKHFDDYKPD